MCKENNMSKNRKSKGFIYSDTDTAHIIVENGKEYITDGCYKIPREAFEKIIEDNKKENENARQTRILHVY